MEEISMEFQEALLSTDVMRARQLLTSQQTLVGSAEIVEKIIVRSLERIGQGWEKGDYALSQIYMSGRICEEFVDTLFPPSGKQLKSDPKLAIATLNDYHALGKRIVYSALRAAGFDPLDYGRVDPGGLVERIKRDHIAVILISVLMLPSALDVLKVREMLDQESLKVKIVVGGAPFRFDDQLWQKVGADAVGHTASDAMAIVQSLVGGNT